MGQGTQTLEIQVGEDFEPELRGRALQNDARRLDHELDINDWFFFEFIDEVLDWDFRVI